MKRIILCADDYGQNSAISQAILELIRENRLSATSCMTTSSEWLVFASWLKPMQHVDVGLHFNLTEGQPVSQEMARVGFPSLRQILLKTHINQINKTVIAGELHAQIDQFQAGMGRLPDFIDGHQHIHHMPVIRDIFLEIYQDRLRDAYIRAVYDPATYLQFGDAYVKRLLIQGSGAVSFKMQLLANKIPHNSSFSGIYTFSKSNQYAYYFRHFLTRISENGIIMCHPGLVDKTHNDAIQAARIDEYRYFKSEQFLQDCTINQVMIGRFY